VAGSLRTIGVVGAVLLLVGPGLVGVGYLYAAAESSAAINCTSNCNSAQRNAENASFAEEQFLGSGIIVGGVGAGLVFAVALQYMGRWPPARSQAPSMGGGPPGPSGPAPPDSFTWTQYPTEPPK